jgi:hypothetical protein
MFRTDASAEILQRYKMDPEIWKQSQRKNFPFNISLSNVIFLSLAAPLTMFVSPFGKDYISFDTTKILLITSLISVFAYHVSNHLITTFKDTLCAKGLFGKDLNKAGERETKEKV